MTNEEFRKQIDDRTDDLIVQLQRHDVTIANIVKSAYERGYADGKASKVLTNEPKMGKKEIRKPYGWLYCSECGMVLEPQDNFCWYCGAEMLEVETNDETN